MQTPSSLSTDNPVIPPFLQERNTDPTTTLACIKTEISNIYTAAKTSDINDDQPLDIDHDKYIKLYTAVFDYTKVARKPSPLPSVTERGELLYQYLSSEIRAYCININHRTRIVASLEVNRDAIFARKLLLWYLAHYRRFLKLSSLVRNLLGFWDRHWIRREWLEKKISVGSVGELHRSIWKEEVLEKGMGGVVDAVGILREMKGDMTDYDLALVKDVVKGLSGLGVTLDS
jgi:hypothetical protein